jgi:hypothetical protein
LKGTVLSIASSSIRSRLKRPTVILSVGVAAAALVFAGSMAANAAVGPNITLSVPDATVNGNFNVTANGFLPNESITFDLGSVTQTGTADAQGHVVESLSVAQDVSVGTATVHATGTTTPVQSASLTIVTAPVVKLSASTVTVSQFTSSPITATVTGFTAGEKVNFGYGTGASGGGFGAIQTADGAGKVSISFKAADLFGGPVSPGTYSIGATNAAGNIVATYASFKVVADPAAPAKPAVPIKHTASFTG